MGTGEAQLCTQLQRAGSAWATGELVKSFDELKKAPFDAAVSVPGKHNRACLAYLLPTLKGHGPPAAAFGSASKLHAALVKVLPDDFRLAPCANGVPSAHGAPAQVNLAASMLANGLALQALQLANPICRAAWSVPDGVLVKAFVIAVEAQLQLDATQAAFDTLQCMCSVYSISEEPDSLIANPSAPAPVTPNSAASNPHTTAPPQPLPCSSVPANDSSCLPAGFSPDPAGAPAPGPALAEAFDSPMSSPARKVIDSMPDSATVTPIPAATVAPAASQDRSTPHNTPSKVNTAPSKAASLALKQLPLPEGLQSMALIDVKIMHAWMRGRAELASGQFQAAKRWFGLLETAGAQSCFQEQILGASLRSSAAEPAGAATGRASFEAQSTTANNGGMAELAAAAAAAADAAVAAVCGPLSALSSDAEVSACCQLAAAEVDGGMASPALASVHLRRAAHELAQGAAAGNMRAGGRVPRGDRAATAAAPDSHRHLPPAASLPLVLHRLGTAMLHRPEGPAATAAAAAAAAAALRAASAPLRGSAVHWLRRGEAVLRAGVAAAEARGGGGSGAVPFLDAAQAEAELSRSFWSDTDSAVHLPGSLATGSSSRDWRVVHSARPLKAGAAGGDETAQLRLAAADTPQNGTGFSKHVKGGVRGSSAVAAAAAPQQAKQDAAARAARGALLEEAEACFCNTLLLLEEEAADAAACQAAAVVDGGRSPAPSSACRQAGDTAAERRRLALSSICSLCYLHLHHGNPHACLACVDRWFRGAVESLPLAGASAAAGPSHAQEAGYSKVLAGALRSRATAAAGSHIAVHVADALCMCGRPEEAVACLSDSLAQLSGLSDLTNTAARRAASSSHLQSLEQLLQSSLAVAFAHAGSAPSAAAAAAAVLLQPSVEPAAQAEAAAAGRGGVGGAALVQAAVDALQQPGPHGSTEAAVLGGGWHGPVFDRLVDDCGGDAFRAAICVAADDIGAAERAAGGGCGGGADAQRLREARRGAWEAQVHSSMRGSL
eukprot:jgi/Ulvmu1/1096/UM106_0012.1